MTPRKSDNDEDRLAIPLDPETALRALLRVDPDADASPPQEGDDADKRGA